MNTSEMTQNELAIQLTIQLCTIALNILPITTNNLIHILMREISLSCLHLMNKEKDKLMSHIKKGTILILRIFHTTWNNHIHTVLNIIKTEKSHTTKKDPD